MGELKYDKGRIIPGKAKTYGELDLVVVNTKKFNKGPSCGTYKNKKGETVTVTRDTEVIDLKVYDRRTGKINEEKTFNAKLPRCPKKTDAPFEIGSIDDDKVIEYLDSLVGGLLRRKGPGASTFNAYKVPNL